MLFRSDVTAYKTYTENQLFSPEISTTTGYSKLYVNAGKVTNKGIELALGFKQNIGPVDWKTTWTVRLPVGMRNGSVMPGNPIRVPWRLHGG